MIIKDGFLILYDRVIAVKDIHQIVFPHDDLARVIFLSGESQLLESSKDVKAIRNYFWSEST